MNWSRDEERKAGKAWHLGASVVALIFGVFWCLAALAMGAGFMLIFGIPFVGVLVYRLVMVIKLGTKKPKQPIGQGDDLWERQEKSVENGFCPYCGSAIEESFVYCPRCGRKLK